MAILNDYKLYSNVYVMLDVFKSNVNLSVMQKDMTF